MKMTFTRCLKGMANEMRWGVSDACLHCVNFTRYLLYAINALAGGAFEICRKLHWRGFSQVDAQLSRRGTPIELRWAVGYALGGPALVVRFLLLGVFLILVVVHGSQACLHLVKTISNVEQYPNKKRTPKKSRPWNGPDEFDDVRVRISELAK